MIFGILLKTGRNEVLPYLLPASSPTPFLVVEPPCVSLPRGGLPDKLGHVASSSITSFVTPDSRTKSSSVLSSLVPDPVSNDRRVLPQIHHAALHPSFSPDPSVALCASRPTWSRSWVCSGSVHAFEGHVVQPALAVFSRGFSVRWFCAASSAPSLVQHSARLPCGL